MFMKQKYIQEKCKKVLEKKLLSKEVQANHLQKKKFPFIIQKIVKANYSNPWTGIHPISIE